MITRRNFVAGLAALIAAPAIVRVSSLMQLRSTPVVVPTWRKFYQGREVVLHGDIAAYASGSAAYIEGLSQQICDTVFYGFAPVNALPGVKFHHREIFAI